MSDKKDNKTRKKSSDVPNLSELFGDPAAMDVTAQDVFAGGLSSLTPDDTAGPAARPSRQRPSSNATPSFRLTQLILVVNMVALTGIIIYLVRRPADGLSTGQQAPVEPAPAAAPVAPDDTSDPGALLKTLTLPDRTTEALDEAISLQTAERLYAAGDYLKAAYVYERLRDNISPRTERHEALADWLTLQMALCLQKTQQQELMGQLFTRALNSRSPVVRALTHYNLGFIQHQNRNYLQSRRHAYQALALLRTIESYMPPTLEADCYFLAAESLTRHLRRLSNTGDDLPGTSWSDAQPIYSLPITDQQQLSHLLTEGADRLSEASLGPIVTYDAQRPVGAQWSAFSLDGPLAQLLWQFASEANINLNVGGLSSLMRRHKTTVYLPRVDRSHLAEVAVGSAGLIWQFDGQRAQVYDPGAFDESDALKSVLIQEAIAQWQRFVLRYRGDHRAPNAHYALGSLYAMGDEPTLALGEYRLLSTRHADNPLAAYGLLGASKIKTNLRDYAGAKSDLNDLLSQYPNSKITDQAMLYLAEATMENGSYAEAAEMFRRVHHLDISRRARRQSAFGLGKCAYKQGRFNEAAEWLSEAVTLIDDQGDPMMVSACLMLGRSLIQTGHYDQAARILQTALGSELSNREYVRIALNLVEAELQREQYVAALNILERIPEARLSQDDAVAVMIARARLYRRIDVPTPAISLLRRKIEFVAESRLRAKLSLELAECYLQNGERTPARRVLNEAMTNLPTGRDAQRAAYLLARIAHENQRPELAESLCLDALTLDAGDEAQRRDIYNLLGRIYTEQNAYDRAAMAYAGMLEP